ncbi:hypothetical protein D3C76_225690 [compost metagenome]
MDDRQELTQIIGAFLNGTAGKDNVSGLRIHPLIFHRTRVAACSHIHGNAVIINLRRGFCSCAALKGAGRFAFPCPGCCRSGSPIALPASLVGGFRRSFGFVGFIFCARIMFRLRLAFRPCPVHPGLFAFPDHIIFLLSHCVSPLSAAFTSQKNIVIQTAASLKSKITNPAAAAFSADNNPAAGS